MINVGIHENLVIHKVAKNDQGTLVIGVMEGDIDPLAALNNTGSTSLEGKQQDFLIFPPKVTNFQGEPDTADNIMTKIADVKDPLDHIASIYLTSDKRKWNIFAGIDGITKENLKEKITNQGVLDQIYNNIVNQFTAMVRDYVGPTSTKVRMVLVRSTQAKHYPTLRKRYLNSNPFIESMTIPAAQSRVKFTAYELKNGLDNPNPVTGGQVVSTEEADEAEAAFSTSTEI